MARKFLGHCRCLRHPCRLGRSRHRPMPGALDRAGMAVGAGTAAAAGAAAGGAGVTRAGAARPGKGLLSERRAGAQPWWRNWSCCPKPDSETGGQGAPLGVEADLSTQARVKAACELTTQPKLGNGRGALERWSRKQALTICRGARGPTNNNCTPRS